MLTAFLFLNICSKLRQVRLSGAFWLTNQYLLQWNFISTPSVTSEIETL
jgi:hypothetical protein